MVDLSKKKDDIIRVLFWFDVMVFIASIFYFEKWFFFLCIWINIICLGSFLVIAKNNLYFEQMKKSGRLSGGLDKKLGRVYGKIS